MNNRLKFIFTFKKYISIKKSSTFANLLMEKPGNWFAIAKMWEKAPEEEKNF